MTNQWIVKKIKNKNSKYDFRLLSINGDFTKVNFNLCSNFRILVSLSTYLTNGIFLKDNYYKIVSKITPAVFNFSIQDIDKKDNIKEYLTLSNNLSSIIYVNGNKVSYINTLINTNTIMYNSKFIYGEIESFFKFISINKQYYEKIQKKINQIYIITGWKRKNNIILDLPNRNNELNRYKIYDKEIIKRMNNDTIDGYCLFLVKFTNESFKLIKIQQITYDEYLTYIYNLMLPYKYDLNDIKLFNTPIKKKYKDKDIERFAFAIDPDGSKDRDDAIAAFFMKNGKITNSGNTPSHLKLVVHISNTLDYIQSNPNNYYYHYSKFKSNTDYLDIYNFPMMDRMLSEEELSLDGDNKKAITINLIYKIINNEKMIIESTPEEVYLHLSTNLNIIGTTYKKFSNSFTLEKKKRFSNNSFIDRSIINCNNIPRDYNIFIYEGDSTYNNKIKKALANNLKQLYIYFVNSLDQAGKDTLIKLPSSLIRKKINDKNNIYLDFSPSDMWTHTLVEYTAIESNIYFSYLMYLKLNSSIEIKNNMYYISKNTLDTLISKISKRNKNLILNGIIDNKSINVKKYGIYRNLFSPIDEKYINKNISNLIIKLSKKYKNNNEIVSKLLKIYNYNPKEDNFLKMLLALRQINLLIESNTNIDINKKLLSKDMIMKAGYDFNPISHLDISSYFYTHATSPMRRFIDINVHSLIFNTNQKDFIFNQLKLEKINERVSISKHLSQLVNSYRFVDFIKYNNNNLVMDAQVINKKKNTIGFLNIVNFFNFISLFNLNPEKYSEKVNINLDSYDIPKIKINKNMDKTFNTFFHMLKLEDNKIKDKCKKFLEKIFNIKKVTKVCL